MKHALAAACLALAASPAAAQMLDNSPEGIMNVARGFGTAQLETSSGGQPMVTGMIDGTRYGVLMYGCDGGRGCESLQFFASFTTERSGLTVLNQWNEDQRFGAAYVGSSGSVVLHWSTNIDYGVNRRNFEDSFDIWRLSLDGFTDHIFAN